MQTPWGNALHPPITGSAGSRASESGLRGEKALQQEKRWDLAEELCLLDLLDLMASGLGLRASTVSGPRL